MTLPEDKIDAPDTAALDITGAVQAVYYLAARESLEKAKLETSTAKLQRDNMEVVCREWRRPRRLVNAAITFDAEKSQWKTEFQGVAAWGDTPEMACDNFDHLWMFGSRS